MKQILYRAIMISLQWPHNGFDSVSNHQPREYLLNRLFKRKSKKTPKLRVTGLCVGNSPVTGEYPHKWPVTRKMFPFDDVIMLLFRHAEVMVAFNTTQQPYTMRATLESYGPVSPEIIPLPCQIRLQNISCGEFLSCHRVSIFSVTTCCWCVLFS